MMLVACNGGDGDATSTPSGSDTGAGSGTVGDSADDGGTNGSTDDGVDSSTGGDSTGGDGTVGGSTGGDTAMSESSSDGGGTDSGGVDPTPILERDPEISHNCTESREITELPGTSASRAEGLFAVGDGYAIMLSGAALELSEVGLDGTLGGTQVLGAQFSNYRRPLATTADTGIAVVWTVPGVSEVLRFAVVGDDQQFVVEPTDVPETAGAHVIASTLVPTGAGGFALFYGVSDNGGNTDLHRLMLNGSGNAIGNEVTIAAIGPTWGAAPASGVPTAGGGQALAYSAGGFEGNEVFFVALDDVGTPRFAPSRISREASDGWSSDFGGTSRRNVIAIGDDYWVTYSEGQRNNEGMEDHATVALAVVDHEGDAEVHTLQAPVDGIEHRWPSFIKIDDRPALTWTSGTIIWICAGCISDHDLNFVVLDPDLLVPASDVVTQQTMSNGIIAPLLAMHGPDILTAGSLDYHASTLAATGGLQCTLSQ